MVETTPETTKETQKTRPSPSLGKHILTVSQLTKDIKTLLETGFETVWVKGEISSFKVPSSGHYYFSLKDEQSLLTCVMFKFKNQYLKFDVQDGLEVICGGRITVYEPRGNYQLLIEIMEPVGLGALQLRFEQLKEKLSKEGLFNPEHKKPLPYLPQKIAIITSPTGAAIKDILNVLNRRFSNLEILLIPVSVQGDKAAPEIVSALQTVNQMAEHEVILLGRGGGSLEDLWAFNEEQVAKAIYASNIPIISCVGHEVDFTIADFVADLRAPTPSAAAELVIKNKVDLQKHILNLLSQLRQSYLKRISNLETKLTQLSGHLVDPRRRLEDLALRLSDLQERMTYVISQRIKEMRVRFETVSPLLHTYVKLTLERKLQILKQLESLIKSLNPLSILERGYSIAHSAAGDIICSSIQVKPKDTLSIRLFKGELVCEVKEVKS